MPHGVRKQGSKWAIVRKDTGRKVGESSTKRGAEASARIRDAAAGHQSGSSQAKAKPSKRKS